MIDYRNGEDALVAAVESILAKERLGNKLPYVFDAISENGSLEATLRFIDRNGGVVRQVSPLSTDAHGIFSEPQNVLTSPP